MILEKKAPLKERYVRYNQAKFVNKNLQKAITNGSRLFNRYIKGKTEANRSAYKRHRNFCVELLRKFYILHFGNILQNLGIDGLTNISSDNDAVTIRKPVEKYQNHPSIKVIREKIDITNNFSFDLINPECISKIKNNLDKSKATQVIFQQKI